MGWINARSIVANSNYRAILRVAGKIDFIALAVGAVFQGIFDKVFKNADEFVGIAANAEGCRRKINHNFYVALARKRLKAIGHLSNNRNKIDLLLRLYALFKFNARQ